MLPHLADETLSAIVDDQLAELELTEARAHVSACADCRQRLDDLRSVVAMLRSLPEAEPPRSFVLGPRVVADPPNVIRLRRWYTATRIGAASLAAGFVFLSAGALYVDSRPASPSAAVLSSAPARDAAKPAPPALAPAAAPAATTAPLAPAPAAAVRAQPPQPNAGPGADPADQVVAATTVRALPTPPPSPTAVAIPTPAPVARFALAPQPQDDAAPLRLAALALGVLTVLALLAAVVARHRLRQVASRT